MFGAMMILEIWQVALRPSQYETPKIRHYWSEATDYIFANAQPGDGVVVGWKFGAWLYWYYEALHDLSHAGLHLVFPNWALVWGIAALTAPSRNYREFYLTASPNSLVHGLGFAVVSARPQPTNTMLLLLSLLFTIFTICNKQKSIIKWALLAQMVRAPTICTPPATICRGLNEDDHHEASIDCVETQPYRWSCRPIELANGHIPIV